MTPPNNVIRISLLIFIISSTLGYPSNNQNIRRICPRIYEKIFTGYRPKGNLTEGVIYKEIEGITAFKDCIIKCCLDEQCNVALMTEKCYHVNCKTDELCKPITNLNPEIVMALVKPTNVDLWDEILLSQDFTNDLEPFQDLYKNEPIMEESSFNQQMGCNVGVDSSCEYNEYCHQNHQKSRAGTCKCKSGFVRNAEGDCRLDILLKDAGLRPENDQLTEKIIIESTTKNDTIPVTRKSILVKVASQEIKLPVDEVTLLAHVQPDDRNSQEKYQYEWTSLQQPEGSTAVRELKGNQLHLSKLVEGLYTFKLTVGNSFAIGETFVNVTVQPPSRINKLPVVIITPANQTIKQPNAGAVLDASSSTDDDGIVAWHWELQQGPLGYQPILKDSATLELNDLTKPGNYTFKLTVTDTDKATSSAFANITVLKFIDYPPEANAGEDKIIYLPHNEITLHGNLSIDDHAISTWEWTKSPDDAQKAVDMQNTRTPNLQLSNLEEGMYTFSLKVTDSAGQSSVAQVHVFVKPPTNKPPIAKAGENITISLPQTWTMLDARNSSDDNKILEWKWEQVEGPSTVVFINGNSSRTNATGLTKGAYRFKISVTDDNNNVASDNLWVIVNQNVNEKPKANAGNNFEITLPVTAVTLNGSNSKDDWAITKYKWTRNEKSLALGAIVEKTDESPILILTSVISGTYIFNLTVYDEQGLFDTDTVTFVVKNDPKLYNLVEITIAMQANLLTQSQYNTITSKLALLVIDGAVLKVRSVEPEVGTNKAKITFYLDNERQSYDANEVVAHLRKKLRVDDGLLGFGVDKLQTVICQNNCSGHGVCVEETRRCKCEAFWMQDMFKVYLELDEDSDCSWSILYVVLGVVCSGLGFIGAMWGIVYLCMTWCARRKSMVQSTIYKLIENTEDLPPFTGRKAQLSNSDSDSDVVFESHSKKSRKNLRNGFNKSGRRIKT